MLRASWAFAGVWLCITLDPLGSQTTDGMISGRVRSLSTGQGIQGATVACESQETNTHLVAHSTHSGVYTLPVLPPGRYRLEAAATGYQAAVIEELDLRVSSYLDINVNLRPLADVWEKGMYRSVRLQEGFVVTFFGPDVDSSYSTLVPSLRPGEGRLQSTLSYVIDPMQIGTLPLPGRDAYSGIVLLSGVAAGGGTSRGIGVAVNGQRPSASNFLLDGLENNNALTTGPLAVAAPESLQEYRISTSGYTAEYGRTSGFLANAITRSGSEQWHGLGYFYLKNQALNANTFQQNRAGQRRSPVKEHEPGFTIGGPLLRRRLFGSLTFDDYGYRGDRTAVLLPTAGGPVSSIAAPGFEPYLRLNRLFAVPRLDAVSSNGLHRLMLRALVSRLDRPNFSPSVYPVFSANLTQNATSLAFTVSSAVTPATTNEGRVGWSRDVLSFQSAQRTLPAILVSSFVGNSAITTQVPGNVVPGSYSNNGNTWEISDNVIHASGSHTIKLGGGVLLRHIGGYFDYFGNGRYTFQGSDPSGLTLFAQGRPNLLEVAVSRIEANRDHNYFIPRSDREYQYTQWDFFAQDSYRITDRLTLNYGVRYENFGVPRNVGSVKDTLVRFGAGSNIIERLTSAQLERPSSGDQPFYDGDNNNWAGRLGVAYSPRRSGRTVLRAGYGMFYDRLFDNLWQNLRTNSLQTAAYSLGNARVVDPLAPIGDLTALGTPSLSRTQALEMFQPGLRTPYTQNFFGSIEHRFADKFSMEITGVGALGRKLITTDQINRNFDLPLNFSFPGSAGNYNPGLPAIHYRGNQGASDYTSLQASLHFKATHGQVHAFYTWSHAIDNQSDPTEGEIFNLSFSNLVNFGAPAPSRNSAFLLEFDSRLDRGDADFDQRHSLVFYSLWDVPGRLGKGWQISQIASFRSGFPLTVFGATPDTFPRTAPVFDVNRADLVDPSHITEDVAIDGGKQLLNSAAFNSSKARRPGTAGRNTVLGPGSYNIDLSISRTFLVPGLGEKARFTLRADAFNVMNHANLGNPDTHWSGVDGRPNPDFGKALYGQNLATTDQPLLLPFTETARQIQILLRFQF